jgi:hypothetical protein
MTPFQRVFGFFYPIQNIASSLVVLGVFGYLTSLLCGISAAQYSNDEELKLLVRISCVTYLFYFTRLAQVSVIAGVADTFRELVGSHFLILCKFVPRPHTHHLHSSFTISWTRLTGPDRLLLRSLENFSFPYMARRQTRALQRPFRRNG